VSADSSTAEFLLNCVGVGSSAFQDCQINLGSNFCLLKISLVCDVMIEKKFGYE
jgi:hypothetical protein